jgi:transcriptional regulator with XRE-family HTH domain
MANWYEDPAVLRERRTRLKITQAQLAKRAGLSQAYVSEIEKGTRPFTPDVAERLWTAYADIRYELKPKHPRKKAGIPLASLMRGDTFASLSALGLDKTPEEHLQEENNIFKERIAALEESVRAKDALRKISDKLIEVQQRQIAIADELVEAYQGLTKEQKEEIADLARRNAEYCDLLGLEAKAAVAVQERDEAVEKAVAALKDRKGGE